MEPVSTITTSPKAGNVAFQRGLFCGLAQAVVASSVLLINAFASAGLGVSLLLSIVSFFTGLAAYFLAGILASKQTGKLSTGVFAGMWTGGIYGIIGFVVSMVIFFQINLPKVLDAASASGNYTTNMDAFRTGAIIGGVGFAIFGILFAVGLGAGLGALGGLIGRNISPLKQQAPVMPVYAVYPGQPMYPGQPVYPVPGQPAPYPQPANAEQVYVEQPNAHPYQPLSNPYQE